MFAKNYGLLLVRNTRWACHPLPIVRQQSTVTMDFPLPFPVRSHLCFTIPNGTAFADLKIDGHRETWPIRSRQFRHWLRRRYYEETGGAASVETIRSALDLLEARASLTPRSARFTPESLNTTATLSLDVADKDWREPSR